ncbi:MAG: ABC transporter ATP-binding protein [Roseburia sp.]
MERDRNYYVLQIIKLLKEEIPLLILSIVVKAINLIMPYLMILMLGRFVDQILIIQQIKMQNFVIKILILLLITVFFSYFDTYISHNMSYRIVKKLRNICYKKIERILPASSGKKGAGDYARIINGDVDVFEWFYAHILVAWIATAIAMFVGGILIFQIQPKGIFILAVCSASVLLVPKMNTSKAEKKGYVLRQYGGELNATIIDGILGMKDIISNQFEEGYQHLLMEKSEQFDFARKNFSTRGMNEKRWISLMIEAGIICAIVINMFDSVMNIGERITFILLVTAFFSPLQQTLNDGTNYGFVFGAAKRVYGLLNETEYVRDEGKKQAKEVVAAGNCGEWSLELNNIHFSYPTSENEVLAGVSFSVEKGESVAIVAASGGGKTTLANLLQRFWDYDSGNIRINGIDIKEIELTQLRKMIAVISQEIYLFNMTIRDNLLMAKPNAGEQEIIRACKESKAWEFIKELPKGLDTQIGERGQSLSGGQRQRLALAQAFLRDTPILIMDEATSNLDVQNEREINQAIKKWKKDKIVILISHRIATIQEADRIVLLQEGKVSEVGKFERMIRESDNFQKVLGQKREAV